MSNDPTECAEALARRVREAIADFQKDTGGRFRPAIYTSCVDRTELGNSQHSFHLRDVSVEINLEVSSKQG